MFKNTLEFMMITLIFLGFAYGQSNSFFADRKANQVGDVITVFIVEDADGSEQSSSENSSESNLDVNAESSGNLTSYIPLFGNNSEISNSYRGDESSEQSQNLRAKMAVVIKEKNDDGTYKIQGEKRVEVNGEKNLLRVEGIVRPRDIGTDNTIYSYNIANADVVFRESGIVNKFIKPGTVQTLLTIGLTGGLVALSFIGGLSL